MTGYKSKRAAAQDKLAQPEQEPVKHLMVERGSIALARSLCYQINGAADDRDDMDGGGYGSVDIAEILSAQIVRLQAALAQPAQGPVQKPAAVVSSCTGAGDKGVRVKWLGGFPQIGDRLYTAPPQRPWVDLTDEEISEIAINNPPMVHEFARAVLAKSKEKNK